ncbi:MAG: AraC family transcriptional regulator [Acetatifactor sp.]|nr:AraC family transcriptional regulator [Acetatifactor sp.]
MDIENYSGELVRSHRILYTPTVFAKENLLHLQEIGMSTSIKPHKSSKKGLNSYLFFEVHKGKGILFYDGSKYDLKAGDCVFIDCSKNYYHESSEDLWTIGWIHFNGINLKGIYEKYKERGGNPVFSPTDTYLFRHCETELENLASGSDYIKDIKINQKLNELITLIMEETVIKDSDNISKDTEPMSLICEYLGEHYSEKITLDSLSERFFINKYYLTRRFKAYTGTTINNYLLNLRITRAKEELRFTKKSVEQIGYDCGLGALYYFSRTFKRVEGISPAVFRKKW